MPKQIQFLGLVFWLVVCFATASIGATASIQASSFYSQLVQPAWAPPAWLFGPVWTVLYTMMAIAAWLVWRCGGFRPNRIALSVFLAQLVLNGLWSWLFFAWRQGAFAFADIVTLWILIVVTTITFWRVSRVAGVLLAPYLAWVSFATALNYSLWQLNPDLLGESRGAKPPSTERLNAEGKMPSSAGEMMIALPDIAELKRITQSLATLDLVICRDWEDRYYSFDSTWSPTEQMASMRDGCGDEWFLLFDSSGSAGLKGLAHESPAASIDGLGRRLADAVPAELKSFSTEPAFDWDQTSFCYWRLADDGDWQEPAGQADVDTGCSQLLEILVSGVGGYRQFASEYYEREFDAATLGQIFDHTPMNPELLSRLNRDVSIDDIREDLVQVGYPH